MPQRSEALCRDLVRGSFPAYSARGGEQDTTTRRPHAPTRLSMESYYLDWANLLLRWVHVITAIAWVGSSFYFVFLDSSLVPPTSKDLKEAGVGGELWAVHGGGFYNPQKYAVAPKVVPEHLHWFYWESYSTWLSG